MITKYDTGIVVRVIDADTMRIKFSNGVICHEMANTLIGSVY